MSGKDHSVIMAGEVGKYREDDGGKVNIPKKELYGGTNCKL
jgi:hypothetical protein